MDYEERFWNPKLWAFTAYNDYKNGPLLYYGLKGRLLSLRDFDDYAEALVRCYHFDKFAVHYPRHWFEYVLSDYHKELDLRDRGIRNLEKEITIAPFLLRHTLLAMPDDLKRNSSRL